MCNYFFHYFFLILSSCRVYGVPYYIGLIVPFIVIYLFNWVIYSVILCTLLRKNCKKDERNCTDKPTKKKAKQNFIAAITLSVLFGLGWGIGLVATQGLNPVPAIRTVFSAAFIICTAFQGLMVFCLQTLRSKEVRKLWNHCLFRVTGREISDIVSSVAGGHIRHKRQTLRQDQSSYESSTLQKSYTIQRNVYEMSTLQRSVEKHQPFSSELMVIKFYDSEDEEEVMEKEPHDPFDPPSFTKTAMAESGGPSTTPPKYSRAGMIPVRQELKPTNSNSPEHTLPMLTTFIGLGNGEKLGQGPCDSSNLGHSLELTSHHELSSGTPKDNELMGDGHHQSRNQT